MLSDPINRKVRHEIKHIFIMNKFKLFHNYVIDI